MRTTPAAVTAALVAALTLTACGDSSDTPGTSDEDTASGAAGGKVTACAADKLTVGFGPSNAAPAAGDTGNIPVTLTNTGSTCTLQGVPDTEVHSGDSSWTVSTEEGAAEPKLTLAENAAASFTITYVRGAAGDPEQAVRPERVEFRLPGGGTAQSYAWPDAEVAVKSAEELDMTVSPFLPSGD
ncbi:DUF4232 domain-containing protein [Streptomyces poonensis]|uniref:DUF4232 domain-containing protein n=1 Tax=Streptomyces poonensis TaxID=68255 RepID=A0A918PL93_9ACTN|nr:DUF4232 domain-containing protein [Streptomyces poonensis]GGZ13996.1 hypothetical protein GCM10010365_37380 [Streptomyces poonensis]GLJ91286.1 hypothetical protein GCM10017589_38920 [Streptomyces poonensis]